MYVCVYEGGGGSGVGGWEREGDVSRQRTRACLPEN